MESTICFQKLLENQCKIIADEVMKGLNKEEHLVKVGFSENLPPHKPILYRWLFPETFARQIVSKYQQEQHIIEDVMANVETVTIKNNVYYALYFGQSKDGRRRYNQHASKNVYSSTLRHTIYGLFFGNEYIEANESKVTEILNECYFEWIDFPHEGNLIECIEGICIALGHYPLNMDGNPAISEEWRKYIMDRRRVKNVR